MREKGVVTEINKNYAVVSVDKKEECAGCGLCLFKDGTNKTEFYAKNVSGAEVGDEVVLERSEKGRFYGAILAFLIPLLLIGVAVAINYLFIKQEIWTLVLSLIFIVVWFILLFFIDKKLKNFGAFRSEIVEVIKPSEEAETNENNDYNNEIQY